MKCMMTYAALLAILTGVLAVTHLQPPLNTKIFAPTPTELLILWKPPNTTFRVTYYTLTAKDISTNKMIANKSLPPNTTRYVLSNLTYDKTYHVQIWWTSSSVESVPYNYTVVPGELYRSYTKEPRQRLPAMQIFYGTILGAILLYVVVIAILIVYACKRRRNNSSYVVPNLSRTGVKESSSNTTIDGNSLEKYSGNEDPQMNRVSTFTGGPVANNRGTGIPDDACSGYERPISFHYLHPAYAVDRPPNLPPRNPVTPVEEHVYQEPKEQNEPDKSNKRSKGRANKKKKGSTTSETKSLQMASTSRYNKVGRHNSMNALENECPVESRALVRMGESFGSMTIRSDGNDLGTVSCADREFMEGLGDGIQITLTLKKSAQ